MNSDLAGLIAHGRDPKTATIAILSFLTLTFGVGAGAPSASKLLQDCNTRGQIRSGPKS
jgi:hypothetical protein